MSGTLKVLPLVPASDEERAQIRATLEHHGLLKATGA